MMMILMRSVEVYAFLLKFVVHTCLHAVAIVTI